MTYKMTVIAIGISQTDDYNSVLYLIMFDY